MLDFEHTPVKTIPQVSNIFSFTHHLLFTVITSTVFIEPFLEDSLLISKELNSLELFEVENTTHLIFPLN